MYSAGTCEGHRELWCWNLLVACRVTKWALRERQPPAKPHSKGSPWEATHRGGQGSLGSSRQAVREPGPQPRPPSGQCTHVTQTQALCVCVCVCLVAQSYSTLCNSQTVARQAPLSMGFSRQEYWSGLPLPPPGDLSDFTKQFGAGGNWGESQGKGPRPTTPATHEITAGMALEKRGEGGQITGGRGSGRRAQCLELAPARLCFLVPTAPSPTHLETSTGNCATDGQSAAKPCPGGLGARETGRQFLKAWG